MNTTLKTRFAPSPTGLMHFGNLRTALFNYLYARHFNGTFLLRIEDTDLARSEVAYKGAILEDLKWLGIDWQEGPYCQSERQAIYADYYSLLEKAERVYPCFCTEEQLDLTRKVQMASHQPPRYPGTCRKLSKDEVKAKIDSGLSCTLRFEVPKGEVVEFEDLIKGPQRFETDHIGDFIIRRNDGSASFMFCNAIDDAVMKVTDALRGDDHLTNTPRQILILQALELPVARYGHFPTIFGPDSRPLSKRNGSRSIKELREEGYQPLAILNYLARLGHHDPDLQLLNMQELSQHFELKNISSSPAHFDPMQLMHWQKEAMHRCTQEYCLQQVSPFINILVPAEKRLAFVETIQPNLIMPADAAIWATAFFAENLTFKEEVAKILIETGEVFFTEALLLLETPNFDIGSFVRLLQEKTGLKGKALFFPVRAALTGEVHGPELIKMLEVMGIEKIRSRFMRAREYVTHL